MDPVTTNSLRLTAVPTPVALSGTPSFTVHIDEHRGIVTLDPGGR